ncbi:MAG: ABC transporter permease [Oscillospiraceae bacterium]|jgi:putative ABC transport system permease protein|nr:ABC transporter permease [Oscillospiraceae bacterium]
MNIFRSIAVSSMRRNRTRSIVTIIGVILSVAMFTAITTMGATLLNHLQRVAAYDHGTYYVAFNALPAQELDRMRKDTDVEMLTAGEILGYADLRADAALSPLYTYVLAMDETFPQEMPVHLTYGRLPQNAGEIILPEHLNAHLDTAYKVGDSLTLALGDRVMKDGAVLTQSDAIYEETLRVREMRTYSVVGIYERPDFEGYDDPGYTALTVADGSAGSGVYDAYARTSYSDYDRIQEFYERYHAASTTVNGNYLMTQGSFRYENYDSFVGMFAGILIFLIMLGAVSLIYSAFSISVSERTRQFGLLASVGATRKQLHRTVLYEAGVVFLIGAPLGLLAGVGGIYLTLQLLREQFLSMFGYGITLQFHVSAASLLIAAAVGLLTVLISAVIPARRAMRVTAIEAIRQSRDVKVSKRDIADGKLAYRLFGLPGMLSKKYFRRSRKKYRATIVSLAMSVVLFVSASTYAMYLTETVEVSTERYPFDLAYALDEITPEKLDELTRELQADANIDTLRYASFASIGVDMHDEDYSAGFKQYAKHALEVADYDPRQVASQNATIVYADAQTFAELLKDAGLTREEYDKVGGGILKAGNINEVYYNRDGDRRYVYNGSVLDSAVRELTIIIPETPDGYQYTHSARRMEADGEVLVSYYWSNDGGEELVLPAVTQQSSIAGKTDLNPIGANDRIVLFMPFRDAQAGSMVQLLLNCKDADAAAKSLETGIRKLGLEYDSSAVHNPASQKRDEMNALTIVQVFSYGFIILISLICVANVFNTVSTNVATRRRDFAMLRSVGMTRGGLNRMMNYECILYGLRALLLGLPLTALLAWLMHNASGEIYSSEKFVSIPALLIAVCSVFAVVFASMMYAMRKIKKDNPVDALKAENT